MITVEKQEEIQQVVKALYAQKPDWVSFYREVLGLHGIVRHACPSRESLVQFEKTDAYGEIQRMLTELRAQGPLAADPEEPTKVITVRLPRSMHETLRVEAHEHHTSMNKLCVSKLLQFVDNQRMPVDG